LGRKILSGLKKNAGINEDPKRKLQPAQKLRDRERKGTVFRAECL